MRHRSIALALLLATLAASAAPASAAARPGCAPGSAASAARALYGSGTSVARAGEQVAGLETVIALEPLIYPGVRHRLLAIEGGWCDAARGFNAAWNASGPARDAIATASAFARLAPVPYFDGVTVQAARAIAPGVIGLRTHAKTNGVVAEWLARVDARGVREARWTAVDFARAPFEAQTEGLTALPGAREVYHRAHDGALVPALNVPWRSDASTEGPLASYTATDGFTIDIYYGQTPAPYADPQIGVNAADIIGKTHRAAAENYEEFLAWGLEKGWAPNTLGQADHGTVYINDALSLYCIACVIVLEEFQIHFVSEVMSVLARLGTTYPDPYKGFSLVVGHEMFHNFQNAYSKPGSLTSRNAVPDVAYSEGMARFQETLHSYASVSHQRGSLVYDTTTNGCNGFDSSGGMNATMARGPFREQTYAACYFWLAWWRGHDIEDLVGVMRAIRDTKSIPDANEQIIGAILQATGAASFVDDQMLAAEGALTGHGYEYPPVTGGAPVDWARYLDRWRPPVVDGDGAVDLELMTGGMAAFDLRGTDMVVTADTAEAALFVVRSTASGATTAPIASGDTVAAPAAGESVFIVTAAPHGYSLVTVTFAVPEE